MVNLMTIIPRRYCLLNFIFALGIFGAGCALTANQKMAVSQFSESAVTLGDTTTSEVRVMRDTTVKMNIARLILGGKSADKRLGDQTSLDRGFDFDRVQIVTGATQALAAYGRTLLALVADTQSSELQAASNEFVASFSRIPNVNSQLSDQQLKAIGTAIQEVGGLWIEWKRRKAVTTIVKESEQAVDKLCDLVIQDFGEKGWVRLQLQVIQDPLMAAATNTLFDARTSSDRAVASPALQLLHDNRMRRSEVLSRITNGAQAMKAANKALLQAVENPEWSLQDIHDFATRAHSLQTAVRTIVNK